MKNELLENLEKIHTTPLGIERIKRNLALETDDVASWCKEKSEIREKTQSCATGKTGTSKQAAA